VQQGPCCIQDFRNWLFFLNKAEEEPEAERARERHLAQFLLVPVWQQHEPHACMTLSRLVEGQNRAAALAAAAAAAAAAEAEASAAEALGAAAR
jgi:hypothetical protein